MADKNPTHFRKRLRPKTYSIGLYLVGLFIIFQIAALLLIFWFGRILIQSEESIATGKAQLELEGPQELMISLSNLPRPEIEGRLAVSTGGDTSSNVRRFIEDARRYRREGDFNLAEAALQEALKRAPDHVLALTHFALLEEARENTEEALGYWKKIIAADATDPVTLQLAQDRAALIEERVFLEQEALRRAEVLNTSRRLITLGSVETEPSPLPTDPVEIQKDFVLTRNQDGVAIDPGKVRIQLFFYDQLPDGRILRAPIEARFLSTPVDWKDPADEILRARYFRADESSETGRSYYGYLLRIYYEDELQDEHASPVTLLNVFPETG